MSKYLIASFLMILLTCSCNKTDNENTDDGAATLDSPNIILIIADDLGKDAISGFTEGTVKPNTSNINAIRTAGLSFNNLWVYPTCSPTRSSIITGKYGYSTGVKWAGDALSTSENILQNYINTQTNNKYATAVIGKWHLSGAGNTTFNPETLGINYYAGVLSGASDYYDWVLREDGSSVTQNNYITEKFTDMSIEWIDAQDKPFFLWLAYTAPHTPFHTPPSEMHSQGNLPEYSKGMDPEPYYMAAIEAMDFQIGRLLSSIPDDELENTTIIFIGDNGSPNQVAQFPYSNATAKGTLYQGGINTPMFISGPSVSRTGSDSNLISGTDLFATISELSGVTVPEINDSKSFKSLLTSTDTIREFQYSEMNDGENDLWSIRNNQFKLIVNNTGDAEMYDLEIDPYENINLLNTTLTNVQLQAKNELEIELSEIRN